MSDGEKEFVSSQLPLESAPAAKADTGARDAQGAQVIDARSLSAPLPLLRAHRALRAMQPGQLLKVVTTGTQTLPEFQALVKYVVGYELVAQEERGDEITHVLRRRRGRPAGRSEQLWTVPAHALGGLRPLLHAHARHGRCGALSRTLLPRVLGGTTVVRFGVGLLPFHLSTCWTVG
jgi:tRNA 2-thiouridine synthesizing protein A